MGARKADAADRIEHHYRQLLDVVREGFAVCRMLRDDEGNVNDYIIAEANAAFLKNLGGKVALGRRLSELRPDVSPAWYAMWHRILDQGEPTRFEYHDRVTGRWYDVSVTPMPGDTAVQVYVDVTHRKQLESEQANLFNELNHRVKNNLTVVSALLGMQAKASSHPQVRHELQQAIDRIQAISEVHAILYKTGAIETVDFAAYLTELCKRLAHVTSSARMTIDLDLTPLELDSDQAVQLGIIVNELITNAVKHAYPGGESGKVLVRVRSGDEGLVLAVRDFGPGLPIGEIKASGVGMRLVKSLVASRGGTLTFENDGGLTATVALPSTKSRSSSRNTPRLL